MTIVRMSKAIYATVLAASLGGVLARADVVHLNDGSSMEGIVKRNGDGWDVTDAAGKIRHVIAEDVRGIELTAKLGGATEAESRLGSLRRSVENLPDTKMILERYARFIEQNKETPIGKEAEKDVVIWQDRIARHMVKVGWRWVTPEEYAGLHEKGMADTAKARQLLKQGRLKDADPILQQAIEEDPTNVGALYLRGWLFYQQEQLLPARKAFETAVGLLKDHAPSLNNLAVVLWRQNAQVQAIGFYDQAMLVAPLNREILNNVAEALNALPANLRLGAVVQKAARHFTEQDTALQQQMAQLGWYRWGSTWVDRTQLAQLKAAEDEVQKKLEALNIDFNTTKKKIGTIDDDIDDNTRRMHSIESTNYTRDPSGNYVRLPLPARYWDYDADNKKLSRDRAELVAKLEGLRVDAKLAQQKVPTPRFQAVQRLIGVEGTPTLPPTRAQTVTNVDPAPGPINPPVPVPPPVTTPAKPATNPASPAPDPTRRSPVPDSLLGT